MKEQNFIVIICSHGDNYFRVHGDGCSDIAKDARVHSGSYKIAGSTVDEAVKKDCAEYEAQHQGYTPGCYKVLPCCHNH
jgi:hypothetical protein